MMRPNPRVRAVLCSIAFCMTPWAANADGQASSPTSLDVDGVRLGMTFDQTVAALKKFDPTFAFTKGYGDSDLTGFVTVGKPGDKIDAGQVRYFVSLTAINKAQQLLNKQKQEIGWANATSGMAAENLRGGPLPKDPPLTKVVGAPETVDITFVPIPGQERVIAIHRDRTFETMPTTLASITGGLTAKYPKDVTYFRKVEPIAPNNIYLWAFDAQQRIMPEQSAQAHDLLNCMGELPNNVSEGGGVVLCIRVAPEPLNPLLTESLDIALYDEGALYRSAAQSQETYTRLKTAQDAAAANAVAKNSSQTKF